MKQSHVELYRYGVYRHYGMFFWKQCCSCKKDFRQESGWRFLGPPFHSGFGHIYYLCSACAPTKNAAHALALAGCYRPRRPDAPPFRQIALR